MREELLAEIEEEYASQRRINEQTEKQRRDGIIRDYPDLAALMKEREELIFGTMRLILDGNAVQTDLTGRMKETNRKISALLVQHGFSSDYLDPVFRCRKCSDTGYTGDTVREPCECLKKAYQTRVRKSIGLDREQTETFETYDENLIPDEPVGTTGITQRQLSLIARDQCLKWADDYPDTAQRDVLISGGSGLGKTFLLRSMASRLVEHDNNVLIISAYTFLQMARKAFFDSDDSMRELMDVPVLMLDDLGSEPLLQNITVEQLFHLINERQAGNLSTVISTNLTLQELRERYTERVASRLNNPKNCLILTLAGRDLRKIER